MGEFEQWFKSLNENGRVTYFLGQEGKIAKEAWDFQQSKIEQLEKKISNFKERINHAEKFINQIPCQSTWEAESRQDAMKALRNGKRFKEPKKLPHTHIFISNTCECGWTVDQEKALRGERE